MSPKVKLEFTLPEEHDDHLLAMKAGEMYRMLWDISDKMRHYKRYVDFGSKEQTGKKRNSKSAGAAIAFFFEKLDNEILDILKDIPEVA